MPLPKGYDADSVYTEGPDIKLSKEETYIYSFAEDLLNKALTSEPDEDSLERMYTVLPELLETFALKVGSSAPTQIHRDVMVFIRRHRSEIVRTFRDMYLEEHNIRASVLGDSTSKMNLDHITKNSYLNNPEEQRDAINGPPEDILCEDDFDEADHEPNDIQNLFLKF